MMTMTQPKPNFKRGDIVLVLFPNSDLITAKTRPAIIVQADDLQTGLPQIIVAMISSQIFRAGHPSRVSILRNSPEGQRSGVLLDSVIMTDNLATIATSAIYRLIGSIPTENVDAALKHTLNLN